MTKDEIRKSGSPHSEEAGRRGVGWLEHSLLEGVFMADEAPSGDKAVYVFIEMIALGFVLYAIEEAFRDNHSWVKVLIALTLGVLFVVGRRCGRSEDGEIKEE